MSEPGHEEIAMGMPMDALQDAAAASAVDDAPKEWFEPRHLFTVETDGTVVTCLHARNMKSSYYFVFKDGALAQIFPPAPYAIETVYSPDGHGCAIGVPVALRTAVEWMRTARPLTVQDMYVEARDFVERERRAGRPEFNPALAIASLIPSAPTPAPKGLDRYLQDLKKYDAFKIKIGSTRDDLLSRLGSPLGSRRTPGGTGEILVFGHSESKSEDFKPPLTVVVLCDDRVFQVYSDFNRMYGLSQAAALSYIFAQPLECDRPEWFRGILR